MSDHPRTREIFFPEPLKPVHVRPAAEGDEEDIARLVSRWAKIEGLNSRRAGLMLELWMSAPTSGFYLALDSYQRCVGIANLTPLASPAPALEPLLQQHVRSLSTPAEAADQNGVVLGMMVCAKGREFARGALLRQALLTSVASGRAIVSTAWHPYQQLSMRLGLRPIGETRQDFYHCGRSNSIFTQTMTGGEVPVWLRRLLRPEVAPDDGLVQGIREALPHLRSQSRLGESPLLALPGLGSPSALAAHLIGQVEALSASASQVDQEAGIILTAYYLGRSGAHDLLAQRLHLSRATYFRRLDHGIRRIAEAMRARFMP
jgi:hypothetical protein